MATILFAYYFCYRDHLMVFRNFLIGLNPHLDCSVFAQWLLVRRFDTFMRYFTTFTPIMAELTVLSFLEG